MTSNNHCQYLPSMGAISPLTNVLTGLPMVQPKSIPYGLISARTALSFDEPSPQLTESLVHALSSTDTSWINLKPGLCIPSEPMEPSPSDPPLIRAILSVQRLKPELLAKTTPSPPKETAARHESKAEPSRSAKRQMKSPTPLADKTSPIRTTPPPDSPTDRTHKKGGRKRIHSSAGEARERPPGPDTENIAPAKSDSSAQSTPLKPDILNINISLGRLKVTQNMKTSPLPAEPEGKPTRPPKRKHKPKSHAEEPEFKSRDARESEELVNEQALSNFNALLDRLLDSESKFSGLRQQLLPEELEGECLLASFQLEQLSTEAWKLGRVGLMSRFPSSTLRSVLSCMQRHISDARGLDLSAVPHSSGSPAEGKKWRGLAIDRIARATEAAQTILAVSGGSGLGPAMVVEEVLESVLEHARFHLVTNIYSEMDPSYRYAPAEQEEEAPSEFVIHVGGRVTKQRGGKARKAFSLTRWDLTLLYFKLAELLESLSVLVRSCVLTDTLVLQLSSLALKPFFVENNATLQLSALKLARNIFSKYPMHRHLILEEIFLSLAKLPSNKRTLRTYCLEGQGERGEGASEAPERSIQMVTALVMQLLQSIASVPREKSHLDTDEPLSGLSLDAHLIGSMDEVIKTGHNFLSTLFKKCYASGPSKSEVDFRPIFENLVQDLLTTLLLPRWPVSGTLLTIMCRLFLVTFTNKQAELPMRIAALEHVGTIISQSRCQMSDAGPPSSPPEGVTAVGKLLSAVPQEVRGKALSSLQMKECMEVETDPQEESRALAGFLLLLHLREREEGGSLAGFWVGTWVRELAASADKERTADIDECQIGSPGLSSAKEQALKEFFLRLLTDTDSFKVAAKVGFKVTPQAATTLVRFLTANLPLLQNFSFYLNHLIRMVNETNVQIRTRAMKSLSSVLSVDPTLIGSADLKAWVRTRMCDMSSMVRESTVELVGRSLQQRPELATEFYDILCERMLDTSVAVRKRVIRILRDSIHKMPPSVHTELCVKLVGRIQEEKSVQQLIVGMFQELWFSPLPPGGDREEERKRAQSICNVVFSLEEPPGFNLVQELFSILLKPDKIFDQQKMAICKRIIDSLVESLLQLDEQGATLAKMLPMLATLHVFSLIDGSLLVSHLTALQPYLASQCSTQGELFGLTHLLKAFSNALPLLLSHKPGPQFLASTEEHLLKLSMQSGAMIVEASLSCLAALVNSVTHNFKIVQDCFTKFSDFLERAYSMVINGSSQLVQYKSVALRSLFTIGLLCRYFEIDSIVPKPTDSVLPTRRVFAQLLYFAKQGTMPECQEKSLVGLGFFFLAHPSLMLEDEAIELYSACLSGACVSKKCQVLTNLTNHLYEDEERLKRADKDWRKDGKDEGTLQDIGDKQSTLSSTMIQRFLPYVMSAFFTPETRVRSHITSLLSMVLRQGLIYPAPCIPCLIAMVTDSNQAIRDKAVCMLEEMNQSNKLMHTQVVFGIRKSFDFLEVVSSAGGLIRGREGPDSKLHPIYSMVHANKQQRRAFLLTLVRFFDDVDKQGIPFLLYVADNLACFNYSMMGEVLFVIHHISVHLSMAGPALIDSFQESMGLKAVSSQQGQTLDESAMLDTESLLSSDTCDDSRLAVSVYHSYAIILLLHLSTQLKSLYCLNEAKCHEYTPNAPSKVYDKPISRKLAHNLHFEPVEVVEALELSQDAKLVLRTRAELLHKFQEFYKLYKEIEVDGGDTLPETYLHTYQSYTELFSEGNEFSEPAPRKQANKEKDGSLKAPKKKSAKGCKPSKSGKQGITQSPKEKRKSIRSKRKFNYFESSDGSNAASSSNEDM